MAQDFGVCAPHMMNRETGRRSGRSMVKLGAAFVAAAFLSACSQSDSDRGVAGVHRLFGSQHNPAIETLENVAEYTIVPSTRAMVNAPTALLVFERSLGRAVEQRIVLPNDTAVSGDNVIHVRAQTSDTAQLSEFSFDEIAARFGGLPAPFERQETNRLSSGRDSLGAYLFAREQMGVGATCVLVIRRIGVGARPLPRGTQALDMVMRNCVNGTVEQALAPLGERALAVGGTATGSVLTLSPHAAPRG